VDHACPLLQLEWCSRLLPSLIISLHEFGAMFTCLPIIVHADHHTWEIIIIIFGKTIFEFTCGAITFYNTMLCIFIYVRRLQIMIVRWELCALVGFVTQVGCNYDLISRKQSELQKLLWQQSMDLGLFTFTCLSLQKCHTLTGFPTV